MIQNQAISNLHQRRKNLMAIMTDVDGILTNGQIAIADNGQQLHFYHALDGFGMINLVKHEFVVAVVSGRENPSAKIRANDLGAHEVYTNISNKFEILLSLSKKYQIPLENWAVVGDDVNDSECLNAVDFSFSVPHAHADVLKSVNFQTQRAGGQGAFREISDWILAP